MSVHARYLQLTLVELIREHLARLERVRCLASKIHLLSHVPSRLLCQPPKSQRRHEPLHERVIPFYRKKIALQEPRHRSLLNLHRDIFPPERFRSIHLRQRRRRHRRLVELRERLFDFQPGFLRERLSILLKRPSRRVVHQRSQHDLKRFRRDRLRRQVLPSLDVYPSQRPRARQKSLAHRAPQNLSRRPSLVLARARPERAHRARKVSSSRTIAPKHEILRAHFLTK
mmetsp:Transcript_363/g.1360  ORF Transcript_363/g.1360 Transcript_363/m.1360 type:complete len:228 (+) Transcript_363:944-1627(+)